MISYRGIGGESTFLSRHKQRSRGNLGDHAPPLGGGEGGGAANQ